jgi:hypothetical protein
MNQKITLPENQNIANARNYKGEKFLVHALQLLVVNDLVPPVGPITQIAELCVWTGVSPSASKFYASLWVHDYQYYISGYGTAGGYGYCKASAASFHAFNSAGLTMSQRFDGAGMAMVYDAMYALGMSLGHCRKKLYVSQGH